jgi:hypothetical protein
MRTIVWMIAITSARVALAQPGAGPPAVAPAAPGADDPTTHPGFVVIDQTDASSAAGAQLSYISIESHGADVPTLLRFTAHARYVDRASGFGAYARMPFTYASGSGGSNSVTDVGNLELGGIFSPRLGMPGVGVILRAGVTLPVGESAEAAAIGSAASLLAMQDLYNSLPRATTLKFGVSPVFRSGPVFARVDLGLDWNLDARNAVVGKALHFDFALGVDVGPGAVMLESENATLFDQGTSNGSTTIDGFAVSARLNARPIAPYIAWVLPIDQDIKDIFNFMITAGAELRL